MDLLIVKKVHGKPSRHGRSGPLKVHLLPCPDLLKWANKTSLFSKQFLVHRIVRFPTLQRSLDRLSDLYLVVFVPLIQLLDNLCMSLNVLWKWLAQMHMVGAGSSCHPQVLPSPDSGWVCNSTSNHKADMFSLSPCLRECRP